MLKLRLIAALPAWLGPLMELDKSGHGGTWVMGLPALGLVAAVAPIRWFPAAMSIQCALLGCTLWVVPELMSLDLWLWYLFLALSWVLNAALYFQERAGT